MIDHPDRDLDNIGIPRETTLWLLQAVDGKRDEHCGPLYTGKNEKY